MWCNSSERNMSEYLVNDKDDMLQFVASVEPESALNSNQE